MSDGYNLVILIMILTVMNIMVAAALPLWSHAAKREKEEELIFRGLQYAEAVRVFQRRHGRPPTSLEELIEVKPRSIRRLWEDPMSESGEWGLLIQGGAPQAAANQRGRQPRERPSGRGRQQPQAAQRRGRAGGNAGQSPSPGEANPQWQANIQRMQGQTRVIAVPPGGEGGRRRGRGGRQVVTTGPIVGVYSATSESAAKSFAGADSYDQWHFTITLIPQPAMVPGEGRILRSRNDWIGRPFREGLQPVLGTRPTAAGRDLTAGAASGGQRRSRAAVRQQRQQRR